MKKLQPTIQNLVILNNLKSEVIGYLKEHDDNGELDTEESFSKLYNFVDTLSINDFIVLMSCFSATLVGDVVIKMTNAIASGRVNELQKVLREISGKNI